MRRGLSCSLFVLLQVLVDELSEYCGDVGVVVFRCEGEPVPAVIVAAEVSERGGHYGFRLSLFLYLQVRPACTYSATVILKNLSSASLRFRVRCVGVRA